MTIRTATAAALALLMTAGLASAQDKGVTDTEIVVGGTMPFAGPAGLLGYASVLGHKLSAAAINEQGGINGRKVRVALEDDKYVPAQSVQGLQKLIDTENIFAFIPLAGGSHMFAMLPIIDEQGIPTLNAAVTTEGHYVPPHPTVFGIGMTYQEGAYELVSFMSKKHPGAKWAIIVQDDESGIPREVGYTKALKEAGLTSVSMQRFKRGQVDFSSELQRVKASGATALLLGGLPADNATMIKEAKKLGLDIPMGTLWIEHIPPMIDLAGPAGDGLYVYDFVPSLTDPSLAPFMALAQKHLTKEELARINRYTLLTFISYRMLADAAQSCGKNLTRKCVVAYWEKLNNYNTGLMPPISFPNGERLSRVSGNVLKIDYAAKKFVPAQ